MIKPWQKIIELSDWADSERSTGVQVHGCFDLLHIGHIRYIAWARSLGPGPLIATITADAYFPKYKGDHRPAFPEDVRAESLAALQLVDFVAIVREGTGVTAIHALKPRIYAKGWEAKGIIPDEVMAVESHGGYVCYMDKECNAGQIYSSGRILSGEYLRSRNNG